MEFLFERKEGRKEEILIFKTKKTIIISLGQKLLMDLWGILGGLFFIGALVAVIWMFRFIYNHWDELMNPHNK
jgi:hypothetical protein